MPPPPEQPTGPSQLTSTQPPANPQSAATDQPAVAEQPVAPVQPAALAQAADEVETIEIPAGGAGGVEKVEVLPGGAGGVEITRLPPLPRAGVALATGVGILISLVTILVLIQWWRTAPWMGVPAGFSGLDAEQAKKLADNLKALSDASIDRSLKLFDDIVDRVLLPVFTSILGYIFGTRGEDSGTPPANK